ncbi:MAG: S46 family peptidase [Sphingobacteriales bacterium]|nr:S46 family peptidase [Sphingobacteriales bacterium]
MRLTYGQVLSYKPQDATFYNYFTTADGILEKEDPTNPEFIVPAKLNELIRKKDFGQYADKDGSLHVNFLSNTDITGGNSGSAVMNNKGELIGIAFDGNWKL